MSFRKKCPRPMQTIALSPLLSIIVIASGAIAACSPGASTTNAVADSKNAPAQTSPGAAAPAASGSSWVANGATACERFLTPDVVGQIFIKPEGKAERLGAQGCQFKTTDFSSISITLVAAGPATFDAHMEYLTDPVPLSGVGDRAVRTATGIEAIHGNDRMCGIDVMPPFGNKLKG